ncbi:MAG: acyl-ACP desaturase [Bacteroidia bacterium]|nr:acyl-ACP desaturase [Bacteroidia bacterium]
MRHLGLKMEDIVKEYLIPIEKNWQPTDFLPDSRKDTFIADIKELRAETEALPYEYLAVLVGDAITEEALPTYESWLMDVEGIDKREPESWTRWVRNWTAEEKRHGDLLNKFIYLSGRVNMREMEISMQHLIADGMAIGTDKDPYRNFVYTSFQEMATNISHRRTSTLANQHGSAQLSKICAFIAADEARHAKAYRSFVSDIFQLDPSEMMLAFEDMMRKKIAMPAHFMRQSGEPAGVLFGHFSDAAQRLGVYTSFDYIEILEFLIKDWNIADITGITPEAEKGRDYIMALPNRLKRVTERSVKPPAYYHFNWIS